MSTLTSEQVTARNELIRENGKATRARRAVMEARAMELKLKPNKVQEESLTRLFLEAKWFRNAALASGDTDSFDTKAKSVMVKTPDVLEERALINLGSHHKQSIIQELLWNKKSLRALAAKGHKIGRLRFVTEVNSIHLKQLGVTYAIKGTRARLQGVKGWVPILGSQQLSDGELASAKLIQKASGYYLLVTVFKEKEQLAEINFPPIGVDMGVATHVTLSDGREYNSLVKETDRLRGLQRKLARQVKGSNNWRKSVVKIRREYERLDNRKKDWAAKLVHDLKQHEVVFFQDESLRGWKRNFDLQHSGLGRLKNKLRQLDSAVMLDKWVPTTQYCSNCGVKNKLPLSQRVYSCACGYSAPRDLHAANNMIILGSKTSSGKELAVAPVDRLTAGGLANTNPLSHAGLKQETNDVKDSSVFAELRSVETQ